MYVGMCVLFMKHLYVGMCVLQGGAVPETPVCGNVCVPGRSSCSGNTCMWGCLCYRVEQLFWKHLYVGMFVLQGGAVVLETPVCVCVDVCVTGRSTVCVDVCVAGRSTVCVDVCVAGQSSVCVDVCVAGRSTVCVDVCVAGRSTVCVDVCVAGRSSCSGNTCMCMC